MKQFRRLSARQARDLEAYSQIVVLSFQMYQPQCDYMARTIEEWFWLWDTHGIKANFHDLQACGRLIQAKATLNLTVKLWVEDIANESGILTPSEVKDWCGSLPEWVWKAFCGQIRKLRLPFSWQSV